MKKFFTTYSGVIGTFIIFSIMLMPVLAGAKITVTLPGEMTSVSPNSNAQVKTLDNPLGTTNSFCGLIIKLVQAVMVIGIPIAILFIVWAGFKFVMAQGNPGKLDDARRNFLNVIIGIGIFIGATLIANVIVNTLKDLGVQGINSCT